MGRVSGGTDDTCTLTKYAKYAGFAHLIAPIIPLQALIKVQELKVSP